MFLPALGKVLMEEFDALLKVLILDVILRIHNVISSHNDTPFELMYGQQLEKVVTALWKKAWQLRNVELILISYLVD